MKPFYIYALSLMALVSCSKVEMQETKDTILGANELLKTAKEGLSSVDSLSVLVRDSAKFNEVVGPELEKHKKTAERLIKGNAKSLDSLNSVLKQTASKVRSSTDLLKTVDSARLEISESSSPFDVLATVSKTLEKLSNQAKKSTPQTQQPTTTNSDPSEIQEPSPRTTTEGSVDTPVSDSMDLPRSEAKIKLSVEDLDLASQALENGIHLYDAKVQSQSYGEAEGKPSRELTLIIPSRNFDRALDYFSTSIGTLRTKSVQSWSRNGSSGALSTLVLTLEQSSFYSGGSKTLGAQADQDAQSTYKDQSTSAFMKGFDYLRWAGLLLLPFWPLLVLGAIGLYFWRRAKAKSRAKAIEQSWQPRESSALAREYFRDQSAEASTSFSKAQSEQSEVGSKPETNSNSAPEDPYEKYKPKG